MRYVKMGMSFRPTFRVDQLMLEMPVVTRLFANKGYDLYYPVVYSFLCSAVRRRKGEALCI